MSTPSISVLKQRKGWDIISCKRLKSCWERLVYSKFGKDMLQSSGTGYSGFRSPVAGVQTDSWLMSESSFSQSECEDGLTWRFKRSGEWQLGECDSCCDRVVESLQTSSLTLFRPLWDFSFVFCFFSDWGEVLSSAVKLCDDRKSPLSRCLHQSLWNSPPVSFIFTEPFYTLYLCGVFFLLNSLGKL